MSPIILWGILCACGFVIGFVLGDSVRNVLRLCRADVPGLHRTIADLSWELEHERDKRRKVEELARELDRRANI